MPYTNWTCITPIKYIFKCQKSGFTELNTLHAHDMVIFIKNWRYLIYRIQKNQFIIFRLRITYWLLLKKPKDQLYRKNIKHKWTSYMLKWRHRNKQREPYWYIILPDDLWQHAAAVQLTYNKSHLWNFSYIICRLIKCWNY